MGAKTGEKHGSVSPLNGLTRRQELFAEYNVAGYPLHECVKMAGYKHELAGLTKDEAHIRLAARGAKLAKIPQVAEFMEKLRAEQLENNKKQKAHLSDKYQMNLEKLTVMLLEDREFARTGQLALPGHEPQKDRETSDWRPDARAAVQATMGLAKLHGLLIDKAEVTVQGSISRMSNEELLQFIQTVHHEIGPVIEVTPGLISDSLELAKLPVRKG